MDKETRNRIQRATQAARELLEHEYAEQLEGVFDIRLDGSIAHEPGHHLDTKQLVIRDKLIAAIEHHHANDMSNAKAVVTYLREAAFTTLNRFVALKMLEARDLVQECISRDEQSAGFKEFSGLAPGLVQLSDHGYRLYIESLFDEVGREVRVLFDRHDPASLLWPRRQALNDLLVILNSPKLTSVWIEDETIGWFFQYFNSDSDRNRARYDKNGKSKAPDNSYELAVRNQFFTPRYVVRFLVENTLGRTWYEMMQGRTILKKLDFLIKHNHEEFLSEGQAHQEGPKHSNAAKSPENPIHITFRPKKDPRDIKVLDPACGSGHFLLYTFDLLLKIYEEAWHDESAAESEVTGNRLHEDYSNAEKLRTAAPELILQYNLHGIDIDPRATQIAALALWLRAQRAFQDAAIPRNQRPAITKTNIVTAEPMPGEPNLRKDFISSLEPRIGQIVDRIFELLSPVGEAGILISIEEEIHRVIQDVYGEYGELFNSQEKDRWQAAEQETIAALSAFSSSPDNDEIYKRRLFANDAIRGMGFIDLSRIKYDVILMNPPFGEATARVSALSSILDLSRNMFETMAIRGYDLLLPDGQLGVVSDRSFMVKSTYAPFRKWLIERETNVNLLDLGWGVLDASVEVCAYCFCKALPPENAVLDVIDLRVIEEKEKPGFLEESLLQTSQKSFNRYVRLLEDFSIFPSSWLAYDLPDLLTSAYRQNDLLDPIWGRTGRGMSSGKTSMACRLVWEVAPHDIGRDRYWAFVNVGGGYSPFYRSIYMLFRHGDEWRELRALKGFSLKNTSMFWEPALGWGKRTDALTTQLLPANTITAEDGQLFLPNNSSDLFLTLAVLNCQVIQTLANLITGGHKNPGDVGSLPVRDSIRSRRNQLEELAHCGLVNMMELESMLETSNHFTALRRLSDAETLQDWLADYSDKVKASVDHVVKSMKQISKIVGEELGLPEEYHNVPIDPLVALSDTYPRDDKSLTEQLFSWLFGVAFGRFDIEAESSNYTLNPIDAVAELQPCSPGMLTDKGLLPLESPPPDYPIQFPSDGILIDDPGYKLDVIFVTQSAMSQVFSRNTENMWENVENILAPLGGSIRSWVSLSFFGYHLKCYTRSRRKAPIYWQLATSTSSYSAWLYYHRFTRDTFHLLLNDHVVPKLQHEEHKLTNLIQEAGPNPTASQSKEIDAQVSFVDELRTFRDELARVAPLWNPNLNDGVILNFAPLWRLVPHHKAWQKECKSTWEKLCKGDYDWAHLAMHLWPERVVPKCAEDRSLAIVHGLEEIFWHEYKSGKWQQKMVSQEEVENLIADRTSPAVKDALNTLQEAPSPNSISPQMIKKSRSQKPSKSPKAAKQNAKTMNMFDEGESS